MMQVTLIISIIKTEVTNMIHLILIISIIMGIINIRTTPINNTTILINKIITIMSITKMAIPIMTKISKVTFL